VLDKNIKRAIYSGTFDPVTNGHLDIINRALDVFDEVIVAVASSVSKQPMFNLEERVSMIQDSVISKNVVVKPFNSLLVNFAEDENVYTIIRGLRAVSDFEYELQMSYANASLNNKIDTIYFMPSLSNAFVSSSVVREVLKFGGDVSHLIPKVVNDRVFNKK